MSGPTLRSVHHYAAKCLRLQPYLQSPGDERSRPRIPAAALLWSILAGVLLRRSAFSAIEALVGSSARRALPVSRVFGDDTLRYFTERLSPTPTRQALGGSVFAIARSVGLDIDREG